MKKVILSVLVASTLSACGGGSDSDSDSSSPSPNQPIKTMTVPQSGIQTFQRSVSKDRSGAQFEEYIYRDESHSDEVMIDIGFGCIDCEYVPVVPTIDRIFDINDKYSFQNMTNSTVEYQGRMYNGRYSVIFNKQTGDLYPIVMDGKPIEFDYLGTMSEPFLSDSLRSTIQDNPDYLYSEFVVDGDPYNDGELGGGHALESIYMAKLQGGAFVVKKIIPNIYSLPDNNKMFVDNQGAIVAELWNSNESSYSYYIIKDDSMTDVGDWFYKTLGELDLGSIGHEVDSDSTLSLFHVRNGEFFGAIMVKNPDYIDGDHHLLKWIPKIFKMDWDGRKFVFTDNGVYIEDSSYSDGLMVSPEVNDCRISLGGEVFCLENKMWKKVAGYEKFDGVYGNSRTVASQNTLYWVDLDGHDGNNMVDVFAYDTISKQSYAYESQIYIDDLGGDGAGVVAVSDSEVMFYDRNIDLDTGKNVYHEYYVNFGGSTPDYVELVVDKLSPVGFMTIQ